MSRDFKQEYEQHMNEQTPDLWARIEANLPVSEASQKKPHKIINRRWMTYGMTAAAAVLICILAVPVLRGVQGGMSDSANLAVEDAAMPEMVMEAEDAGGMAENGGVMYAADGAVQEEVRQEAKEVDSFSQTTGAATPEAENSAVSSDNDGMVAETEKLQDIEQKMLMSDVEVEILEMFEAEGKVLYRADANGREVVLAFGEGFSEDALLLVGEKYELSLQEAEETATWDYVIVGM